MSRSTQWLSLTAGIVLLGYGIYKLLAPPQPDWVLLILGLMIVAFSVSKIMKSREEKRGPERSNGP